MLPFTVSVGFDGSSSENVQRCLGSGMPDFLNLLRRAFASPSPETLWKGAMRIFVGSVRNAAPMDENMADGFLSLDDAQRCMRWALQSTESIASITKSQLSSSSLKQSAFSGV